MDITTYIVLEFRYSKVLKTTSNSEAGAVCNSISPFAVSKMVKSEVIGEMVNVSSGSLLFMMIVTMVIGSFSASAMNVYTCNNFIQSLHANTMSVLCISSRA